MFARSSGRLFAQAVRASPAVMLARPSAVRTLLTARTMMSSPVARSAAVSEESDEGSHLRRIEYMLTETPEPSQETLMKQLQDGQVVRLPLVISVSNKWQPPSPGLPLPRRDRANNGEDEMSALRCAEYLYNTFHFPTVLHLRRFNKELATALQYKFRVVHPVLLSDPRSRTLTVGMPAYVGIEPPFPANQNSVKVRDLLTEYRSGTTPPEQKQEAVKEIRSLVVPRGFAKSTHILSLYLSTLYESMRSLTQEQVLNNRLNFSGDGSIKQDTLGRADAADTAAAESSDSAQKGSRTPREGRRNRPSDAKKSAPRTKKPDTPAERLQADDPKLPEAGTFVAEDGDRHPESKGVDDLKEHVPFPTPTAEEMGIKKPTET